MPLSINKLEKLLTEKGLIPRKFFVMDGLVIYIEVFSIVITDIFMLYIPKKYDILVGSNENVYKAIYINISEDGNIPDDYAGEPDNFDIQKQYDEVDVDLFLENRGDRNMTDQLEENYNHPVSLKNISKDDIKELREVFRQLRRLKFCVQSLKYKICIIFKDYLCCIRRDDTFEGFIIHNLRGSLERKLMISIDLETLYEKIDSLTIDIKTIREGIYRVLDKNQNKHAYNLQKMLEQKNDISIFSDVVLKKKTRYTEYLTKMEQLLTDLGNSEKKNIEKLLEIDERYSKEASLKGLHIDIEKTHQISKYESELSKINVIKQELITNILMIRGKHEDLVLKVDNIIFDNNIMVDAILKNLVKLSELQY